MTSLLPSIIALGLAVLLALYLAVKRSPRSDDAASLTTASHTLGVAVITQSIHFTEELLTGFHERFPGIFGLEAIPLSIFVIFNIVWITIWIASIPGIQASIRPAYFAAWFLAIAGILNGVAHPLLSLAEGAYFPGLFSSPFVAIACFLLWRRLQNATQP